MTKKPALTLGPVYYLWNSDNWRDFYYRIADESPIDRVVIGETICSKRVHFTAKIIETIVQRLEAAGKEVIFSSLALITLDRELKDTRKLIDQEKRLIEVNDLAVFNLLENRHHTISPLVNVYNGATAKFYATRGAQTICLPPELPLTSIKAIAREVVEHTDIEVFAFGRLPLALSARCAHARAKGHIKDNCHFVCGDEPNGLAVKTIDGKNFLSLNGIQTLSHTCQVLTYETVELKELGVNRFRLSPQTCDMTKVAAIYDQLINGRIAAAEAAAKIQTICAEIPMSNGFIHGVEGSRWIERSVNLGH